MKPNKEIEVYQFLRYVKINLENGIKKLNSNGEDKRSILNKIFDNDSLYSLLKFYGTNGANKIDKNMFLKWIKKYKFNTKINVFVDPGWNYFCQFISRNYKFRTNYIKLYIALDEKHLESGAIRIFNFLSKNNITHLSKIGSEIRMDNIVIRVLNKESAEKLINFVKNDTYIQEGLLTHNPFLLNDGGVSLASDGSLSFNYTLATLISNYMQSITDFDTLTIGEVIVEDFYTYVRKLYYRIFVEETLNIKSIFDYDTRQEAAYLKGIMNIILKSNTSDFTRDNLYEIYEKMKNGIQYLDEEEIDYLDSPQNFVDACIFSISIMINKYGKMEALERFSMYVKEEDPMYLTRKKGVRNICIRFNVADTLKNYTKYNNITVSDYLEYLIENKQKTTTKSL